MVAFTIGMPTYNDFDGVYFTLQALRLYEDLADTELLVVDNFGCQHTKDFVAAWTKARYVLATDAVGTAAAKNRVFAEAQGDAVLCCDSHVLFAPGAIARLMAYHRAHPDSRDLLQGPLVYDDLQSMSTHFDPQWRGQMWGIWATDPRGADPDGEPFEIPMQGMGVFSCRRDAWPGFNPRFRGFGGEEGYIHEKVRQAGGRCLCLPFLRWVHRFGRPAGVPYPISVEDKLRNYVIGHAELGLDLTPVLAHFEEHMPADTVAAVAAAALDLSADAAPPAPPAPVGPPTTLRQLLGTDAAYADLPRDQYPPGFSANWAVGPAMDRAIAAQRPRRIIEVGTWEGTSAIHMARICAEQGIPCEEILCVDTWTGSAELVVDRLDDSGAIVPSPYFGALRYRWGYPQVYHTFLSNVIAAGFQSLITPVPMTTDAAHATFKKIGLTADLIYIDGAHDFDSVLRDLRMYWELLEPGGTLIGDDYHNAPGVRAAADAFALETDLTFTIDDGKYVVRKPLQEQRKKPAAVPISFPRPDRARAAGPPLVSCICPTYGRPPDHQHLLEEAIESFLRQTYPLKELIVLNDCPTQELVCDAPGVRVVNAPARYPTLGDKYNAAVALARGDLIAPWEDDDISLPWRLALSVERLGDAGYYNPRRYWFWDPRGFQWEHPMGYGHNLSLFSRAAFETVGGYPAVSGPQDAEMDGALRSRVATVGDEAAGQSTLAPSEWFYIYRWGVQPRHLSGHSRPGEFYRELGEKPFPAGRFVLNPHWDIDYDAETRRLLVA